jgi:hypothetical protein
MVLHKHDQQMEERVVRWGQFYEVAVRDHLVGRLVGVDGAGCPLGHLFWAEGEEGTELRGEAAAESAQEQIAPARKKGRNKELHKAWLRVQLRKLFSLCRALLRSYHEIRPFQIHLELFVWHQGRGMRLNDGA